jgi:precorrin-6A/cobalt-precorrin-6A reductase
VTVAGPHGHLTGVPVLLHRHRSSALWTTYARTVTDADRLRDVPRILLVAGSSEASALARRLSAHREVSVISSFAGRVRALSIPPGEVRVGGFGGPEGLAQWMTDEHIAAVIDASHPFTAHMPHHVVLASRATGVPHLRVLRPEWTSEPEDRWTVVPDLDAAARHVHALGPRRVFLTTGRQELTPFTRSQAEAWFLVRSIEMPDPMPLANAQVVLSRGPFGLDDELAIMRAHRIDTLVTKNSGGSAAAAKLAAARQLGVDVVMIARPPTEGPSVGTIEEALGWCHELFGLTSVL